MTVNDLKSYIESETAVATKDQKIYFNNQELSDGTRTLGQCQVVEDSLMGMQVRPKRAPNHANSQTSANNNAQDPEFIRLQLLGNPRQLAHLRARTPQLADAVRDQTRFHQIWQQLAARAEAAEQQRRRLAEDPFNIEAQQEILDSIWEEGVAENIQNAIEHNPEGVCF